jgi:hypothetical protein
MTQLDQLRDLAQKNWPALLGVSQSFTALHHRFQGRAKEAAILRGEFDFGLLQDAEDRV